MFRHAADCAGRQQVVLRSRVFQLRSQRRRRWRGRLKGHGAPRRIALAQRFTTYRPPFERFQHDRSCPFCMRTNTSNVAAIRSSLRGLWRLCSCLFPFPYRGFRRISCVIHIFPPFSHDESPHATGGASTVTRLQAPYRPVVAVQKTTAHFLSVCRCKAGDYVTRSCAQSGLQSDTAPRERPQKWCPGDTTLIREMCYAYQSDSRRVPQIAKKCGQEMPWNK